MIELNIANLLGSRRPNASFHDAVIHTICLDYDLREAKLDCELCIDDPDDTEDNSVLTRRGVLKLTGLLYFVTEPPDETCSFEESKGIEVAGDGPVNGTQFKSPIPKLPELTAQDGNKAFIHWLYVSNWNACIFFAATGASFEWKD